MHLFAIESPLSARPRSANGGAERAHQYLYSLSALLNVICYVSRASAPHAPRDRNASLLLLLLKRLKATFLFASETPQRRRRPISSAAMYVCDSNICSACDASRCRSPIDARLLFAQISSLDSHGTGAPRRQVLISARDTKNKVHLESREEERNSGVERTRSKNGCNQVLGTLSGGGERQGRCSSRPDRDFRCAHNTHTQRR